MTENQEASSSEQEGGLGFSASEKFVALGFDPVVPIYEIQSDELDFGIDRIKKALFESTYREPVYVPLCLDKVNRGDEVFPFVVRTVTAVFEPYEKDHTGKPVGCWNEPYWLVAGHLIKAPDDPYPEFIRVLAYLMMDSTDHSKIESMHVQLLREAL